MSSTKEPIVVGIVGGIASGKSQVTKMFQEMGAAIVNADAVAHEVLREAEVIQLLVKSFGTEILQQTHSPDAQPEIDRAKMAVLVFGNGTVQIANRKQLESIVHPRIRQRCQSQLDQLKADKQLEYIVLDVPLLIESGWLPACNKVIFVETPDALRESFALERGWTKEQWQQRESAQLELRQKKQHATDVLVNDGSLTELRERLLDVLRSW